MFSDRMSQRVQLQPLPSLPDRVARVTYKEFMGEGAGSSPASALFKILDAVATQGCYNCIRVLHQPLAHMTIFTCDI